MPPPRPGGIYIQDIHPNSRTGTPHPPHHHLARGPHLPLNNPRQPPSGYYSNADPYSFSNIDLAEATAYSVNTAFVQLEQMVGTIPIAKVARALGLDTLPLSGPDAVTKTSGSLTLGAWSFSPLQMAAAYATLAASGLYCVPRTITSVSFGDHVTVPTPQGAPNESRRRWPNL